MALTVLGRYSLGGGPPSAPVMPVEGEMYYRDSLANIRKAIFLVSDVIHAVIPVASRGTVFDNMNAVVVNNNYVSCERNNATLKWNFIDLTTGVVVNVIGAAHAWSGRVYSDGVNVICPGNTPASLNLFTSKVTPPVAAEVTTPNAAGVLMVDMSDAAANVRGYFNGEALGLPAGRNFHTTNAFSVSGPDRLRHSCLPNVLGGGSSFHFIWGPLESNLAATVFYNYGTGDATNRQGSKCDYHTDGFVYGTCWFSPAGTGGLWRWPISTWPAMQTAPEYDDKLLPMAAIGTGAFYETDAFHINREFGKVYYAQGVNMSVLHHGLLGTWPIVPQTPLALDPGNFAIITGIWTFPPFVYIAKTNGVPGGGTPDQLIRIYDSDLVNPRKARRSGTELWAMIPEMKDYLG